jgi:hypothetical protein
MPPTLSALLICLFALAAASNGASAASTCHPLVASDDPERNTDAIVHCLFMPGGNAELAPGRYAINKIIKMPPGSSLRGASGGDVTITTVYNFRGVSLLNVTNDDIVSGIHFFADGHLPPSCCSSVIEITGSAAKLADIEIADRRFDEETKQPRGTSVTGLYFIGDSESSNNAAVRLKIHNVNKGVIFRKDLTLQANNRIDASDIFNIACDSITFAGAGVAEGNRIHDAGFGCKQEPLPIPGGGIYALDNVEGAIISNNTITEVCGSGLDIVRSKHFIITGNKIVFKNGPNSGGYPYCVGGSPGAFVDDSHFKIDSNVFYAENLVPLGRFFRLFPGYRPRMGSQYAAVPDLERQFFSFRLLENSQKSSDNQITNNKITASCTATACVGHGVGLLVGPVAGGEQPNTLSQNTIAGELPAILRCGVDRVENNKVCVKNNSNGDCAKYETEDLCPKK